MEQTAETFPKTVWMIDDEDIGYVSVTPFMVTDRNEHGNYIIKGNNLMTLLPGYVHQSKEDAINDAIRTCEQHIRMVKENIYRLREELTESTPPQV